LKHNNMPSSINLSPARSVALNRSFTDDGCDQPATYHHNSLHVLSSPHNTMIRIADEEEGPSMSEILGCSHTRTICGVKISKDLKDSNSFSGHESRSSLSQTSDDDCASMNDSQSSHTTASHSTQQTGWNLETKLARSQQRRKRLEGRFQRERSKRRSTESDRDQVLKFVKGLLLGLEEEENKSAKSQTYQRRISSIREFVSQHERRLQGQNDFEGSSSHDDLDDYDDVLICFPPKGDSKSEQRVVLSQKVKEEVERSRPQSSVGSEYSSDSSYDTCEAEDEFPELPVKFRSIEELRSCEDTVDETLSFFSMPDNEARDEDIFQTEDINEYKQKLENLQVKFAQSTQEHRVHLDSMERRFRDESLKREDLLERALTYAEQLEESGSKKSREIASKQKDLETLAHQHFRKIELLRRGHREELREQKENLSKDSAARYAKEIKVVKKLFEEELKKQMKESNARQSEELKAIKKSHEKDLDDLAKVHETSMQALKEEKLGDVGQTMKLQNLENSSLLEELQERDATIKKLRAENAQKNKEFQSVQQTLLAHRSIIVSLEKQRKKQGREAQRARDMAVSAELASSTNLIRQLQEELRGRDAHIEKLEEQVLESKETAAAQADNNMQINSKLQEQLQERVFEIALLRNEHAQALNAVEHRLAEEKKHAEEASNSALEVQRLKKQLEQTKEDHAEELQNVLREKDGVLEDLETQLATELRKVRIALDETKEKHARDVAAFVSNMNLMSSLDNLEQECSASPTRRSSYHRSRIEEEYEVSVANIKSRTTGNRKKGKKKKSLPSLFTHHNTVEKPAAWVDLDSTSPTVSTSCSSLDVSDRFFEDDDQSTSTFGSRNSLPPRHNEVWTTKSVNMAGGIMASNDKRAPKNKLPPSLLNIVGGLVTHK